MDIIKIPTDNLYKFMAIFGGISLLISITIPVYILYNLQTEVIKNRGEFKILNIEREHDEEYIQSVLDEIKKEVTRMENIQDKLHKQTDILVMRVNKKTINNKLKISSKTDKIRKATEQLNKSCKKTRKELYKSFLEMLNTNKTRRVNAVKIRTVTELIKYKISLIKSWRWATAIGGSFALLIAIYGFILWYKRVQKPLDDKAILQD